MKRKLAKFMNIVVYVIYDFVTELFFGIELLFAYPLSFIFKGLYDKTRKEHARNKLHYMLFFSSGYFPSIYFMPAFFLFYGLTTIFLPFINSTLLLFVDGYLLLWLTDLIVEPKTYFYLLDKHFKHRLPRWRLYRELFFIAETAVALYVFL